MKRLVKLVVFLLVLLTASLAWADEWTYACKCQYKFVQKVENNNVQI